MNDKQKRFVEEYMVDSNATQAAIRAGYSKNTAAEQGYQLLQKPSVKAAIQAAQAEHRERTAVTVESITEKLRVAYDLAKTKDQPASMVQAAMGIAKLHGYLVDRVEQTTKAADIGSPSAERMMVRGRRVSPSPAAPLCAGMHGRDSALGRVRGQGDDRSD